MIARTLKLALSLSLAAGVLLLGAAAGGAVRPALAASRRAAPPAVPGSAGIPVGDALRVNGQPMQLSIFFTSDPPERVVLFHARAFRARGLVPVVGPGHVSVFDARDRRQRFVTALAQPGGDTLVMTGAVDLRHPPRLVPRPQEADFPVPPGSAAFLDYASEDAGTRAETGQFVTRLSPAQVAAFYRTELLPRGWLERTTETSPGQIAFTKGGEVLSVALEALDRDNGCAVFVARTSGTLQ